MFRALKHEGTATACLYEIFVGSRRMSSEQRVRAVAGCAVIAKTMQVMRE